MVSLSSVVGLVRAGAAQVVFSLPAPVIRRLAGKPIVIDGRTLDPQMQLILALQKVEGPAAETLPITKGRRVIASQSALGGGKQPIGAVTDRTIDGPAGSIGLRFYTPRGLHGRSPALLFIHGGGWIYGNLESHDALCRVLAEEAQVRVVSVDYRLAPEAPFPAAFDDVWAAWIWVVEHAAGLGIDPERIAVGGDSAGGNLSAIVAQEAVRTGTTPPVFQLLIYPATDFVEEAPSRLTYAKGFFLTKQFMDLARENYLVGDEDTADRRLSPLRHDPKGVAPAFVSTAGFDPLMNEGEAYVEAMRAAGVKVEHVREDGLIHGYANMVGLGTSAPAAVRRLAAALQRGVS